jgi:hypothetical protein
LISAAGGSGAALANDPRLKLDGVDNWGAISLASGANHTPGRSSILLHLVGPPDGALALAAVHLFISLCFCRVFPPKLFYFCVWLPHENQEEMPGCR